jgi:hypothetical protein
MGFRREKRLTDFPLPEALEVSFQRSQKLSKTDLAVWIEATTMNIDRLLAEYRTQPAINTAWDMHHHALQLAGMTRAITEMTSLPAEL